jgi:hypothetical protein
VAHYKFITYWKVNAPLQQVWDVIRNIRAWHEWWHGVLEVREIKKGTDDDHGACFAHTWQSLIPYKLKFITEVTGIETCKSISADVTGELEGTGRWEFIDEGNGITTVVYYWFVRTTMTWMNVTAPFLSGVFRWNHDTVMKWGGKGLGRRLSCDVAFSSKWLR